MYRKLYRLAGIILLTAITSVSCSGQTEKTKEAAINKIKTIYPSAKILETEIKQGFTEVEFLYDGNRIEIGLNDDNEIIYQEKEAKIHREVLAKINKKLNKSYAGWKFDEAALIELTDTSFYKFEMISGGTEENVYFTLNGKYYRPSDLPGNEGQTVKMLLETYRINPGLYNFLKPDKIYELPETLIEISGITLASENMMFCVQDEMGAIFEYDLQKGTVANIIRFEDKGDFEDIAIDRKQAYVLRSDGTIYHFDYKNYNGKINKTMAPSNSTDIEGLFFDATKRRLYMACKNSPVSGKKEIRVVYQMAPDKIHDTKILLTVDIEEINRKLAKKCPELISGSSLLDFNPSAIAVHPISGETYILSANSRLLVSYEKDKLKNVFPLPSDIFYKPEGLAFSKNGDLYISSEGIKNGAVSGRILLFSINQI